MPVNAVHTRVYKTNLINLTQHWTHKICVVFRVNNTCAFLTPPFVPWNSRNRKIFEVQDPLDPGADRFQIHDMELKEEWQDEEFPR